jgi:hypothetical protein
VRKSERWAPDRKPAIAMLAAATAIAGLLAWLGWIVTRPDERDRD